MPNPASRPRIVGIGGTTKAGSSTEKALQACLAAAARLGAAIEIITGAQLATLPLYSPEETARTAQQQQFVASVRDADGLILATPAYHAGMSGLLKNAIDLLEDLREAPRPYLDGRAVGCIVTAYGWQGAGTTLTSVRSIVHALRGWPTPLGVTLNTALPLFDAAGACTDERTQAQFEMLAAQVVGFARRFAA
ncbi:MAG TPA: NADPH-dependent FMN reductase [Steroidobacter sp.]|uniref:NADPH-dependent FMN reductase n=1 Tax=Steroidobacter sp. TaxID=1978227 RepID=UPI002EDB296D